MFKDPPPKYQVPLRIIHEDVIQGCGKVKEGFSPKVESVRVPGCKLQRDVVGKPCLVRIVVVPVDLAAAPGEQPALWRLRPEKPIFPEPFSPTRNVTGVDNSISSVPCTALILKGNCCVAGYLWRSALLI